MLHFLQSFSSAPMCLWDTVVLSPEPRMALVRECPLDIRGFRGGSVPASTGYAGEGKGTRPLPPHVLETNLFDHS